MKKIVSRISVILTLAGFILALGTAGAADLDLIELNVIVTRIAISAALMLSGWFGLEATGTLRGLK